MKAEQKKKYLKGDTKLHAAAYPFEVYRVYGTRTVVCLKFAPASLVSLALWSSSADSPTQQCLGEAFRLLTCTRIYGLLLRRIPVRVTDSEHLMMEPNGKYVFPLFASSFQRMNNFRSMMYQDQSTDRAPSGWAIGQ